MTPEKLRTMTPEERDAWADDATEEELEAVTDPCQGEAHSNPWIDNCGSCLSPYGRWGRVWKRHG